jgi:hypothetical protein
MKELNQEEELKNHINPGGVHMRNLAYVTHIPII